MRSNEIKEKILNAQSCLVLEVTNKLSSIRKKVAEVKQGREYIAHLTGRQPYGGLVYTRQGKQHVTLNGLDVIAKVKFCERQNIDDSLIIKALEHAYFEAYSPRDAKVASQLWERVVDGEDLTKLLYVNHAHWDEFRCAHPHLIPEAKDPKQYVDATSNTKGALVRAYVQYAINHQHPELELICDYEYKARHGKLDIDILVIGDRKKVLAAVGNKDYFKTIKQTKEVRKASGRLRRIA